MHAGDFCRRLSHRDLMRLADLFAEIVAWQNEAGLFKAGLNYSLLAAWQRFTNVRVDSTSPNPEINGFPADSEAADQRSELMSITVPK